MNLADTTDQAGHLQQQNSGDGSGTSSFAGISEGQVDESCIAESPQLKEKKQLQSEEAMRPRHLQVPNATSKLRGIGIVNANSPNSLVPLKAKSAIEYDLEEANKIANAIVM